MKFLTNSVIIHYIHSSFINHALISCSIHSVLLLEIDSIAQLRQNIPQLKSIQQDKNEWHEIELNKVKLTIPGD